MYRFIIILSMFVMLVNNKSFSTETVAVGGKVVDTQSKQPLPGAIITIPDLRISVVTDRSGAFRVRNIPAKGRFLVEIRFIGYETLTRMVDLAEDGGWEFELKPTLIETQEVVVTGTLSSGSNKRNSTTVNIINKEQLLVPSTNLIDAIAKSPGVSQVTTGPSISKPVIRGLSYNRVVTIDNGIKQEGQQWGDEHGIEIDQFKANRVEVLKGAASLIYGSDALGGVINLLEPLPVSEGEVSGEFITNYATNNGLTSSSVMLTGHQNGFVWRGRGTYKSAYSFKTPVGYFPNSGFNENDFSAMLGLNKSWGYTHLNFSSFRNHIGFYEPAFNSEGAYVDEKGSLFSGDDFKSRRLQYPKQDIRHYKISLNNNILLGSGNLKFDLGFQRNQRRELEDGPDPSLYFNLDTYTGDARYYIGQKNGWEPVFGLSTEIGHSENRGEEFLIPAYDSYGIGAFGYIKKNWENSTFNVGLRYDFRKNVGKPLEEAGEQLFQRFINRFSNLSGAVGFTHQFTERLNFKTNFGSAFRAPNPAELGSNGEHEGTFRYELGNPDLQPERSYQIDAELSYGGELVSASATIYNNYIHDFIYAAHHGEFMDDLPVYNYGQVNANLYGAEASFILHPVHFIHFENTFGYTHAKNTSLDKPLPFIPAAVLRNELRFEPEIEHVQEPFLSVGLANYFAQNRVDAEFETPTAGYTLLSASLGATFFVGKQAIKLYVSGNNLLNKKYYDALSRYKPGRLDQTDLNLGVYNPGRNITFGIYLPFVLKQGN
ncbi:TonB-dependent receptor [Olivibacter sp. XZL3]|uniref:TonB-dependent receptor n=1 Tax=Olivibacter sp. XZL3 TaxID=1735116 RepID=UPI001416FC71|nr:TonB-dependent receptor [Olivibacter sp. XZL3]